MDTVLRENLIPFLDLADLLSLCSTSKFWRTCLDELWAAVWQNSELSVPIGKLAFRYLLYVNNVVDRCKKFQAADVPTCVEIFEIMLERVTKVTKHVNWGDHVINCFCQGGSATLETQRQLADEISKGVSSIWLHLKRPGQTEFRALVGPIVRNGLDIKRNLR